MNNKLDPHIIELESKIQILERENEVLSAKAEENLLLSRAFDEIDKHEDIDSLLINTLESVSILLDIQFSGIFDLIENQFKSVNNFALFHHENNIDARLTVSEELLATLPLSESYFTDVQNINLELEGLNTEFKPVRFIIIPMYSSEYKDRYFVFASDNHYSKIENRIPLLKKVSQIISAKLDKFYYKAELTSTNKELQLINNELKNANNGLLEKNKIINDQNTELKATLRHIQEMQAQLIQSEKMASLGVLTAGVAHEINNPLNFIVGGCSSFENILSNKGEFDTEEAFRLLKIIKTGVKRTESIVSSLNRFSRIKDTFDETCEIHSIVENCLVMLNNQLKHRIEVKKNYVNDILNIKGNEGKLHQVFLNVLTNASQAIDGKGIITISTKKENGNIVVEITDSGCGISEENLSKITDPFYTTKAPGKGTGLGLSISYSILEEHNSKIEFKSKPDQGTTVKITFPYIGHVGNRYY